VEKNMNDTVMGGFRALDLTDERGIFCGKMLADMGVDTIKIERPGGDALRNRPPFYKDIPDREKNLNWFAFNSNKRGITLNLESERGREIFRELVKTADFLIESYDPGYMSSLGLGYEELCSINPHMIMTSITPFGQTGPYTNLKASDLVVQAMGVLVWQAGDKDRAPLRTTLPQAFLHAGADACEGTMIAHYYRGQTSQGQHVDVSIMESVLWVAGRALPFWDAAKFEAKRVGKFWDRPGRRFPAIWDCKDGYVSFLIQGGLAGDRTNKALMNWMDSENIAPQFMKERDWDNWDWNDTNQDDLDRITGAISRFFEVHTAEELVKGSVERGIMLDKVCDSSDTLASTQLEARDFWVDLEHEELGRSIRYPGAFGIFSLTPLKLCHRAPRIGEHNQEILGGELCISSNELADMKLHGII
jgi:benzylsuccinate CoA-transferase BbsE subunit